MKTPLLIGGATTNAAHTAIKIAPHYSGPTVPVLDASRSVPVTTSLVGDERERFIEENEQRHAELKRKFEEKDAAKKLLTLEETRANRFTCDWKTQEIAVPERGDGFQPSAPLPQPTYLDTTKQVDIQDSGNLPHWTQSGATYGRHFPTRRFTPRERRPRLPSPNANPSARRSTRPREKVSPSWLPTSDSGLKTLFLLTSTPTLDAGHGACHLGRPEVAQIVRDSLEHFEGQRYHLHAWCIMPNHIHVVFTAAEGSGLSKILHSWKAHTAKEANAVLGTSGTFWQKESYDPLVRDDRIFTIRSTMC